MSVKKADRTQSSFEVISNAIYMRGQFDLLFIRNLGIKNQDSILRQKYDIPINDTESKQEFVINFFIISYLLSISFCKLDILLQIQGK